MIQIESHQTNNINNKSNLMVLQEVYFNYHKEEDNQNISEIIFTSWTFPQWTQINNQKSSRNFLYIQFYSSIVCRLQQKNWITKINVWTKTESRKIGSILHQSTLMVKRRIKLLSCTGDNFIKKLTIRISTRT